VDVILNEAEARVLGALVEKQATTPDYYPLSLNALVNACNQKSNRHPVMNLDEDAVRAALGGLSRKNLAGTASGADSRVAKFEHRLQEAFNVSRPETAVLCVLLLRGPQTPGELRGRAERLYRFDDLDAVHSALQRLMDRQPPMVKVLARQPGTKEARYAHLLSGEAWESKPPAELASPATGSGHPGRVASFTSPDSERIARLETEVASLTQDIAALKQQIADFRKQFE
jgi:uncharacterized protein